MPAGITQLPGLGSYPCDRLRMFSVSWQESCREGADEVVGFFLDCQDLFFFCLEMFLYQCDVFVGYILDLFFGVFGFVFAEAVFL
jgi:hypothetical protein